VAASFEVDAPAALVEVDLSALDALPKRRQRYREVSRHPQVRRDIAVLVDRDRAADDLLQAIRKSAGRNLVSVEVYDRYEGKGVPKGQVSLAFRMVFQGPDRTLTDREVAGATDQVVKTISDRFGAELR